MKKKQEFWAITSYFKPCHYQRRFNNYKIFRKFLKIPLVTVELSFDGKFELTQDDADILVQIEGSESNIMWQKERLLNNALIHLPDQCEKVAWLDCDIIFEDKNWHIKASELLDQYQLVQLFKQCYHLPKDFSTKESNLLQQLNSEYIFKEYSNIYYSTQGKSINNLHLDRKDGNCSIPGLALASHKNFMTKYSFYDSFICGSGDVVLFHSSIGNFEYIINRYNLNNEGMMHYLKWAKSFFANIQNNIYYLDCNIFHLWHGEIKNRYYKERYQKLKEFNFNPYTDIILDDNNCWRWNSDKPQLHQYLKKYFNSRKEDS